MKLLFTLFLGCFVLGSAFSQVTVYETGSIAGDPWTGWTIASQTGSGSNSLGGNVYAFSVTNGQPVDIQLTRQFTINSNDIDIWFTGTSTNGMVFTIEYSTDNSNWTVLETATVTGGSPGLFQVSPVEPTYDPVVTTFYIKVAAAGTGGTPGSVQFNTLKIDAVVNSGSSVSIAPTATQNIAPSTNGTVLTATETPSAATSREWKYSTTTGTGYVSFGTPETGLTYTPNFAAVGTYYVICESDFSGTAEISNEVRITVSNSASINESSIASAMKYYNNILNVVTDEIDYQISIFDLSGKLMLQEKNLSNLQFSTLPKGVYIVNMTTESGEKANIKVSSIE